MTIARASDTASHPGCPRNTIAQSAIWQLTPVPQPENVMSFVTTFPYRSPVNGSNRLLLLLLHLLIRRRPAMRKRAAVCKAARNP